MLVLSRREGEKIMIGDDIVVCLVEGHAGKSRIGIEAPKDVPVHREEVYDALVKNPQGGPAAREGARDAAAGPGRR